MRHSDGESAPEDAGRVSLHLFENHVDGLVGFEVEVQEPLAVVVRAGEGSGAVSLVAELGGGVLVHSPGAPARRACTRGSKCSYRGWTPRCAPRCAVASPGTLPLQ